MAEDETKTFDTDERWTIEKTLTAGGQGQAYLVVDSTGVLPGKHVMKRLKGNKQQARDRFMAEIAALQKLDHPGIVKIVHFGLSKKESKPFYVMPYLPGGDLVDFIREHRNDKLRLLKCFLQICVGVQAAHDKKIIHRDLKPENIVFNEKSDPVIVDFGICFDMVDDNGRLTKVNEVVGTRGFTAPELEDGLVKAEDVNAAVDVYSLGKLLWCMLASKDEPVVFSREQWAESRNDLVIVRDDIDMKYVNDLVLSKTVVHDPRKRYPDVKMVIARMEKIIGLVSRGFEPLRKQGMTCKFCGDGSYMPVIDKTDFTNEMFASGSQVGSTLTKFGLNPQIGARWRVLVCDSCGHVQLFRFDHRYTPGDPEW